MREIKLRAWDKNGKAGMKSKMLQVTGIMAYNNTDEIDVGFIGGRGMFAKDEIEIMQCTGFKDLDCKDIYEGDIVCFEDCSNTESGLYEQSCIGVVEWSENTASFEISNRLSAESYEVLDECRVVGNVYENPELLEEEQQ